MIVFICGPYGADHNPRDVIELNIETARNAAIRLARAHIPYICPHLNSRDFDTIMPAIPEASFYAMYLEILSRCDIILTVGKWEKSPGATIEVQHAQNQGIPVYHSVIKLIKDYKEGAINAKPV